jgi:hypothetical protein
MVRTGIVGLLALVVVAAQTCADPPRVAVPRSQEVADSDFAGKVVGIGLKGSEKGSYIKNCTFRLKPIRSMRRPVAVG